LTFVRGVHYKTLRMQWVKNFGGEKKKGERKSEEDLNMLLGWGKYSKKMGRTERGAI